MSEVTRGQTSRKIIRMEIEKNLAKYLPMEYSKLANLIAYDYNLSPYTVRYTYLPMFLDAGIIQVGSDGKVYLTQKGEEMQVTVNGLTKQQLIEELQEENERRAQLGKPPVSFEEWLQIRRKRFKPLESEPKGL